jgi:hypothetical protein
MQIFTQRKEIYVSGEKEIDFDALNRRKNLIYPRKPDVKQSKFFILKKKKLNKASLNPGKAF